MTTDHLSSTRVVTNSSGAVISRHDYLPFGEEILVSQSVTIGGRTTAQGYSAPDDTRQKFTSKERDNESGLDYFEARYFSSMQGRFTSPDEFAGGPDDVEDFTDIASDNPTLYADIFEPQSLNKYQYCYNNPLRFIDPNGHQGAAADALKATAAASTAAGQPEIAVGALATLAVVVVVDKTIGWDNVGKWVKAGAATGGNAIGPSFPQEWYDHQMGRDKAAQPQQQATTPEAAKPAQPTQHASGNLPKPPKGKGSVPPDKRDKKRVWTKSENQRKLDAQNENCPHCGKPIPPGKARGHHIVRHADGGKTNDSNHAVVCSDCHTNDIHH